MDFPKTVFGATGIYYRKELRSIHKNGIKLRFIVLTSYLISISRTRQPCPTLYAPFCVWVLQHTQEPQ